MWSHQQFMYDEFTKPQRSVTKSYTVPKQCPHISPDKGETHAHAHTLILTASV